MIDHANSRILCLFISSSLLAVASAAKDCYKNNGQLWEIDESNPVAPWVPCNENAEVSACCSQDDYCLSNGLCLIQNAGSGNRYVISQEGCTDPDWPEPCGNFCDGKSDDPNGYMFPWQCPDESWCCGTKDETCCDTADHFFPIAEITGIQPPVARLATAISSTSATSITSITSASTPTGTALSSTSTDRASASASETAVACPATSSDNSTRDLAIGLGVGLPLGLAIIAAMSFLGFQVRKKTAVETALASAAKEAAAAAAPQPPSDGSNYASSSTNCANQAPDPYQAQSWYNQDGSQQNIYRDDVLHRPPINKGNPRELYTEPIMRELES
ncbi:hypothetical protein F5X99DRAFT_373433 [Biscogniauxia marginata]|nr:hypothetical protein F5X99DRAFT_373433 [Biscogniauxia marginata]